MIPTFPQFKKLTQDDKDEVTGITSQFDQYSDFNFTSLWVYDTKEIVELSRLNGNLVVKFQDYLSGAPFYSFLGNQKANETAAALIELSKTRLGDGKLKLIPEAVASLLSGFKVEEDINNHDYVIGVKQLVELKGGMYMSKRNHIHNFEKSYGLISRFEELDLNQNSVKESIVKTFINWEEARGKMRQDTEIELSAINRLFLLNDMSRIRAFGVWAEDSLAGFSICELLTRNQALYHFEKADVRYKGIFAFLKNKTAEKLRDLNIEYWNIEQDLGEDGLRISKSECRPVKMLKKYLVSINE